MIERRGEERSDAAFLLAILYTMGFFGFLFLLMLRDVPPGNGDMISQLIPVLSMIQGGIIQYFYQKSAAAIAERKDDTIKTLVAAATGTGTGGQVTPGPKNEETGNVPAVEALHTEKDKP